MEAPQHIIFVAVEPNSNSDQERLAQGLRKLMTEDPSIRISSEMQSGKTIIRGMAELQLEVIVDRLRRDFRVEMTVGRPQVAYRERLTQVAEGEGRFLGRIGGRDQHAHAQIRLLPGEPGSGYVFESQVSKVIPKEFIKSIDEGIQEALTGGVLAGYPVDDVRVELYDGSFHEVDSSEMAFRIAGALAFQDAAKRARPVLLEPIMAVEMAVPEVYLGDIISDLNSRRGCIESLELRGATHIIKSSVPLAEMLGYASGLRLRTQGSASYSMHFDRYKPRPGGPHNEDDDRIAHVVVPRTSTPKGKDSGVAIPEPDNE